MASPVDLAGSLSAAALLNPKTMKKQMAKGNSDPVSLKSTDDKSSAPSSASSEHSPAPSSPLSVVCNYDQSEQSAYEYLTSQGQKPASTLQATPTPDPKMLLNPRVFRENPSSRDSEGRKSASPQPLLNGSRVSTNVVAENELVPAAGQSEHRKEDFFGQTTLLEKAYNVSHREERPNKRQKVDKSNYFEEEQKKSTFVGGSSGQLSEYVKEKRKEGIEEATASATIVDLTADDDEVEEVMIVGESQDKEVCYGRIEKAKVQAHAIPSPSPKTPILSHSLWPSIKLSLVRHPGKDNIIRVLDPTGFDFGNIDIRTSLALARLMDSKSPKFRTQARLIPRKRGLTEVPRKEISDYFDVNINLYGPKKSAIAVGRWLGQRQVWLRTPMNADGGIEIFNPHAPSDISPNRASGSGTKSSISAGTGSGYFVRTTEEIRSDVMGMFDSLERSEDIPEMEPDPLVLTPLLSHQKQALHFLTNREQPPVTLQDPSIHSDENIKSLWRVRYRPNGVRTYYNIITGKEEREKPKELLGGILADMMGLGKTLNMLALIAGSLKQAADFSEQECPDTDGENVLLRNSRATLLVAPLSTLANWEQQIQTHLKPKALKYYIYHGSNRTSDVDELAEYDVVITTYAIVASEKARRNGSKSRAASPLFQTNFFRVVLDEAHAIREQSTQQSQAICALSAERRWAVTGTPVQNRLDDLGGLIKYLRLYPFSEKGGFAQFILSPFKGGDPDILPKLRLLVDSITLRRMKDRIDLPAKQDVVTKLDFTADERRLYDWFAKDSQNRLRIIASEERKSLGGTTYAHILRAILRLRLLCAHGRELLGEEDLKIAQGFNAESAIDLEAEDKTSPSSLNARQAYEMLMLLRDTDSDKCIICENELEAGDEMEDEVMGFMLPCYHMVCVDCIDNFKASIEKTPVEENKFRCPSCSQILSKSFFELTESGIEAAEETRALARQNPRQAKIMGRYGGPHSKVNALLGYLRAAEVESNSLQQGEPPIKSVVFSGWTTYLDLIQLALEDNGIKLCRLDGKMSRKSRNASLEAFRSDPTVRVILVSVGAGGLGLNLTTGSRVFMMEPQFNPAAEQQAVDRVHRLGQKRDVSIYRFIMRDSFEEKILELQTKKQDLANTTMNRQKLDKGEAAKKKLDELRSLFR